LCVLGYLAFAPFVLYVEPPLPSLLSSRLSKPQSGVGYIVGKEGGIMSRFRTPSLVVATPLGGGEEYEALRLVWGEASDADFTLPYSKVDMFSHFLGENEDKTIGILYDDDDGDERAMAESLLEKFPSAIGVPYSGRVSVVNEEEIVSLLDSLWGVVVLDAGKSRDAWTSTRAKVIMDNLSASSSVSLERVISIGYDWRRILSTFFREGRVVVDYTFTVLENTDKV
ncbi:MAG: hypothetical protein ACI4S4_05465, partial [Candidatus Ornithospirochaeta sp.]